MLKQAAEKNALAPADHPQVLRLRAIARRLIPFSNAPNLRSTSRAANWKWEVNLIGSKQINAFVRKLRLYGPPPTPIHRS